MTHVFVFFLGAAAGASIGYVIAALFMVGGESMTAMRRIVVNFVYPIRTSEWCAYYSGEEERGHFGWGRTQQEAIRDLVDNYGGENVRDPS